MTLPSNPMYSGGATAHVPLRWREFHALVRDYLQLLVINRGSHEVFARELDKFERQLRDQTLELEADVVASDEAEILAAAAEQRAVAARLQPSHVMEGGGL